MPDKIYIYFWTFISKHALKKINSFIVYLLLVFKVVCFNIKAKRKKRKRKPLFNDLNSGFFIFSGSLFERRRI